jgi:hypothetical protein
VISSILSIISGLFQALGWIKQKQDENTGEKLQQNADLSATVTEAVNAQKIDAMVDGMSDAALDAELRGTTSGK